MPHDDILSLLPDEIILEILELIVFENVHQPTEDLGHDIGPKSIFNVSRTSLRLVLNE